MTFLWMNKASLDIWLEAVSLSPCHQFLRRLPMIVISHVLRFSFLLCVLVGFLLILSEKDELKGFIDSVTLSSLRGQFPMPLDGAPMLC